MKVEVNRWSNVKLVTTYFCLLVLILVNFGARESSITKNTQGYFTEEHITINNTKYFIVTPTEAHIDFEITRPSKNDQNILFCVAGAYTNLKTHAVDGLHICKGKVYNKDYINYTLDGGIKIINEKVEIFSTNYGKSLNDSISKIIADQNGIFFQQTQCIENGVSVTFKDSKKFKRRGIITLNTGGYAVVESEQSITLKKFADDMVSAGAENLLNFDMGGWDEGWYRNPATGQITVLGQSKAQTDKQSNWVILRK